jgi:hypothetical protein
MSCPTKSIGCFKATDTQEGVSVKEVTGFVCHPSKPKIQQERPRDLA